MFQVQVWIYTVATILCVASVSSALVGTFSSGNAQVRFGQQHIHLVLRICAVFQMQICTQKTGVASEVAFRPKPLSFSIKTAVTLPLTRPCPMKACSRPLQIGDNRRSLLIQSIAWQTGADGKLTPTSTRKIKWDDDHRQTDKLPCDITGQLL